MPKGSEGRNRGKEGGYPSFNEHQEEDDKGGLEQRQALARKGTKGRFSFVDERGRLIKKIRENHRSVNIPKML